MAFEGGCFCGEVRYVAEGEVGVVVHCHCRNCRRSVGAPFVTWVEFQTERFRFAKGEPGSHVTGRVERTFCVRCGTPLTYLTSETPAYIYVTAGTLDDPESIAPQYHNWTSRQLSWVDLADDLPRYGTIRSAEEPA